MRRDCQIYEISTRSLFVFLHSRAKVIAMNIFEEVQNTLTLLWKGFERMDSSKRTPDPTNSQHKSTTEDPPANELPAEEEPSHDNERFNSRTMPVPIPNFQHGWRFQERVAKERRLYGLSEDTHKFGQLSQRYSAEG